MANTTRTIEQLVPWISLRQLEFWCEKGYLHSETRGTGDPRTFSPEERRVLVIMARLVRAGIPAELSSRMARAAVSRPASSGTKARLLISPEEDTGGIVVEIGGL